MKPLVVLVAPGTESGQTGNERTQENGHPQASFLNDITARLVSGHWQDAPSASGLKSVKGRTAPMHAVVRSTPPEVARERPPREAPRHAGVVLSPAFPNRCRVARSGV